MKCEPSSLGRACICTFAASDPASFSVSANEPNCSPLDNLGIHRCFCSCVPKSSNARIPIEWCAFTKTDVDAQRRPISSSNLQFAICEKPLPQYFFCAVIQSTTTCPHLSF